MKTLKAGIWSLALWLYCALAVALYELNLDAKISVALVLSAFLTLGLLVLGIWELLDKIMTYLDRGDRD